MVGWGLNSVGICRRSNRCCGDVDLDKIFEEDGRVDFRYLWTWMGWRGFL